MREAYSGWIDCELDLDAAQIEHLGACEACQDFVSFAQSTPSLLRIAPKPMPVREPFAGLKLVAAGLLGFASVAPALLWLERENKPSTAAQATAAQATETQATATQANTTEMAFAVHALRQTSLARATQASQSLAPSVKALQTLTEKR